MASFGPSSSYSTTTAQQHHHHPGARKPSLPPLDLRSLALPSLPPGPSSPLVGSPSAYSAASRPRPAFAGVGSGGPGARPSSPSTATVLSPSSVPLPRSPFNAHYPQGVQLHDGPPPPPRKGSCVGADAPRPGLSGPQTRAGGGGERASLEGEQVFAGHQTSSATLPPTRQVTQSQPSPVDGSGKRRNPLEDLLHTETLYVEDLGAIIKRVAAAWSRSNFPPPALDTMFRAIEAVYRINKSLLAKLNEIGPNPSSPKALGDLLMRWISDLSPAYTRFASVYSVAFDSYGPVQSNPRLAPTLESLPWPSSLPPPDPDDPEYLPSPSLDQLFELPVARIDYYRKLFAKLLKSTQEGRADHALLVDANDQLDQLSRQCELGSRRQVGGGEREESQVGVALGSPLPAPTPLPAPIPTVPASMTARSEERSSGESGRVDSPASSYRSSSQTGTTTNTSQATHLASSATSASSSTLQLAPPRIDDLERRLDTARVLDIFTMTPKKCRLQISPPNLPFDRQLRLSSPVHLSFFPLSDPSRREVIISNAYILLLTDLFLVCQRMTPSEVAASDAEAGGVGGGADLWLLYPPLAGKHLRVAEGRSEGELEVTVMRKEKLTLRFEGGGKQAMLNAREWKEQFAEAMLFGAGQAPTLRSDSTTSSIKSPLSPSFPSQGAHSNASTSPQPLSSEGAPSPRFDSGFPTDRRPSQDPSSSQFSSLNQQRRAFSPSEPPSQSSSAHSSLAHPPPRVASMYRAGERSYQSSTSLGDRSNGGSPLPPPSPNYPASTSSSSEYGRPGSAPGDNYANGRQSPHYHHPQHHQQDFAPPLPPSSSSYNNTYPSSGRPTPSPTDFGCPLPPTPNSSASFMGGQLSKSNSSRSNGSFTSARTDRSSGYPDVPPPLPAHDSRYGFGGGPPSNASGLLSPGNSMHRSRSAEGFRAQGSHYRMPSEFFSEERSGSSAPHSPAEDDDSPPSSPVKSKHPEKTTVSAQMRAKVFLQQAHGQWKSLGTAKLKLYLSTPSLTKQLVVDSDKSGNKTLVSTIVLTDGVERVGKTGVAIELSDRGQRTGIIYMLQMKTEQATVGLFEQLLVGSDRAKRITR